jgi:hypothetical protein
MDLVVRRRDTSWGGGASWDVWQRARIFQDHEGSLLKRFTDSGREFNLLKRFPFPFSRSPSLEFSRRHLKQWPVGGRVDIWHRI